MDGSRRTNPGVFFHISRCIMVNGSRGGEDGAGGRHDEMGGVPYLGVTAPLAYGMPSSKAPMSVQYPMLLGTEMIRVSWCSQYHL